MSFLFFLLSSLGISYAWSDTDISVPMRNLVAKIPYIHKPLLCHECSSFWISLALSFLFVSPLDLPIIGNILMAFCGLFVNMCFVRNNLIPNRYT
jgi:hypothetical protein